MRSTISRAPPMEPRVSAGATRSATSSGASGSRPRSRAAIQIVVIARSTRTSYIARGASGPRAVRELDRATRSSPHPRSDRRSPPVRALRGLLRALLFLLLHDGLALLDQL